MKKLVPPAENFWSLPVEKTLEELKSSEKGLTPEQIEIRLQKYGPNEVVQKRKKHSWQIFFSQFKNSLVLILIAAAAVSFFLGEGLEGTVILGIMFLNSLLGFFQEYRTEKVLQELRKYLTLKARVIRNGEITEIESVQIVPGDIVLLKIGDVIPADIRLIEANEMVTDESSLTGESIPVYKTASKISPKFFLPQDLKNIAFMDTTVSAGEGQGVVITTGKNTFFGKTAAYLKQPTPESDFQKSLKKFSNFLLIVILIMTVFIFVANAFLGKGAFDSFLFALALAVGITPEALPVIMTITLSNGALAMSRQKVVCKRLASVEDLGNIDTLCCDKTGTLTEGKLTLVNSLDVSGANNEELIIYGLLCNSIKEGKLSTTENPIDKAIWGSKLAYQFLPDLKSYPFIDQNPFTFERRRTSVIVEKNGEKIFLAKGSPDSILNVCQSATLEGKKIILDKSLLENIHQRIIGYEKDGYTIIAIAQKKFEKNKTTIADEKELNLLGYLVFLDPPKETAKEALRILEKLKVNIKTLSGDSPAITRKICHDIGLEIVEDEIIIGEELEKKNEIEFKEICQKYNVFSRVTPEQKMRIVKNLNTEGHIVGFLGDGINDAPALKAADVGISVNSGASISKEAADIILLRKSLRVIASGIIEGRKTFGNITKYILNTTSAHWGNMLTVAFSSLFMSFIPLLPSQILLNNFVTDVPMVTISTDNVGEEFTRKPKRWNINLIGRFMVYFGLISSFYDLCLILPLLFLLKLPISTFRTAWFLESALSEIVSTFAIRSKFPFYKSTPSKWLVLSSVFTTILSFAIIYSKIGSALFNFEKLSAALLGLVALILISYFFSLELAKKSFFKVFEI